MALHRKGREFIERFWTWGMPHFGRLGNLSISSTDEYVELRSYNEVIARRWHGKDTAWVTDQRFSVTTSTHTNVAVATSGSWKLKRSSVVPRTYEEMFAIAAVEEDRALEQGK